MKKVAVLQSNYIPWKGYFDIIKSVDEFIIYDDVQFTKNDWRNRNKIKTHKGVEWLTIPVRHNNLFQKINETKISDKNWTKRHWKTITINYAKSKFIDQYKDVFEELYLGCTDELLTKINFRFIKAINQILQIQTKMTFSSDYELINGKNERLLFLLKQAKADVYVSGPAAKNYIIEKEFKNENIDIQWMDYSNYPIYNQLYPPFEHGVSIIDLIFNEGPDAIKFININRIEA